MPRSATQPLLSHSYFPLIFNLIHTHLYSMPTTSACASRSMRRPDSRRPCSVPTKAVFSLRKLGESFPAINSGFPVTGMLRADRLGSISSVVVSLSTVRYSCRLKRLIVAVCQRPSLTTTRVWTRTGDDGPAPRFTCCRKRWKWRQKGLKSE